MYCDMDVFTETDEVYERHEIKSMKILAFDTSGPMFGVALSEDGEMPIAQMMMMTGLDHLSQLHFQIDHVLQAAQWDIDDIEMIAVSHGPGSFTGLRIGISAARAFAQIRMLPVVPIQTHYIIADAFRSVTGGIVIMTDARKGKVYALVLHSYGNGQMDGIRGIEDITAEDIMRFVKKQCLQYGDIIITGNGIERYGRTIQEIVPPAIFAHPSAWYPRPENLARLAFKRYQHANDRTQFEYSAVEPYYLRRSDAEILFKPS